MMKSMTGFGRASAALEGLAPKPAARASGKASKASAKAAKRGSSRAASAEANSGAIDVSVRAVNGRFFEARIHAPREYAEIEAELKRIVAERISRGTVDVYVNRRGFDAEAAVTARPTLAKTWLAAVRGLAKDAGLRGEPSLELLLKSLDVVQINERAELSEGEKAAARQAVEAAVERCDSERRREGRALQADLLALLDRLGEAATRIESHRDDANADLARKYRERLQKLGFEGMVDAQRLAQEVAAILERADVSEELSRLREHMSAYRKLLEGSGPQGKKLDFYAQELLREVNTIGSKAHSARMTEAVVDAKALIERVREQVQNAE